jgi:hypothetical protein
MVWIFLLWTFKRWGLIVSFPSKRIKIVLVWPLGSSHEMVVKSGPLSLHCSHFRCEGWDGVVCNNERRLDIMAASLFVCTMWLELIISNQSTDHLYLKNKVLFLLTLALTSCMHDAPGTGAQLLAIGLKVGYG